MRNQQERSISAAERHAFAAALCGNFPLGALPSGLLFVAAAFQRFAGNLETGRSVEAFGTLAAAFLAVILLLLYLYPPFRRWGFAAGVILYYAGFFCFCLGENRDGGTMYLYYSMLLGTVCMPFPSVLWLWPVPVCAAALLWQDAQMLVPVLIPAAAALCGAYMHYRRSLTFFLSRIRLERLSERDELTGLYNRRGLCKQAERLWAACRENRLTAGVLMVDIDDFKAFNDTYGHVQGDECLRQIAQRITSEANRYCAGRQITVRYGGEEFLVISDHPDFLSFAGQIVSEVRELRFASSGGTESSVTISAGLYSGVPDADSQLESFIEKADEALYAAKKHGKNRLVVYSGPMPAVQIK